MTLLDSNIEYATLKNGIQLVHRHIFSDVSYCGLMIGTGTRDEAVDQSGMAHFIEHTVFKGTEKRTSRQIINRLEDVGGDMNAYTTKEETVVYAAVPSEYAERATELLTDMVFHSVFPANELKKELSVIYDEIESYNDSPSELIYDDFEALIFTGNALERPILGTKKSLRTFTPGKAKQFIADKYNTDEIVFFSQGNHSFAQVQHWAEKFLSEVPFHTRNATREKPEHYVPQTATFHKKTHQTHIMCGNMAYSLHHPKRQGLFLLNNILGGQGMNCRLNLALRERNGLVYNVESSYTAFSDIGYWNIYFGCDPENAEHCMELCQKEIKKLCEKSLSNNALQKYKLQLRGQLAIGAENQENNVLAMAKSVLYFGKAIAWQQTMDTIDQIDARALQEIANEIFDEKQLSVLKYE